MLFNNMSLDWAVARAARLAEINNAVSQSDISQAINNYLSSIGLPAATVQYSSTVVGGIRTAYIAANYSQSYVLPMISTFNIAFSSNITVPQPT